MRLGKFFRDGIVHCASCVRKTRSSRDASACNVHGQEHRRVQTNARNSPSNHKAQHARKYRVHFTKRPCAHLYCRLTASTHRFDAVSGREPAEPAGNPKEKDR
jgi:hypothetical protein